MKIPLETILNAVSAHCRLPESELISSSRKQNLVFARAAFANIACNYGYTHAATAKLINRDRATVNNLLKVSLEENVKTIIANCIIDIARRRAE